MRAKRARATALDLLKQLPELSGIKGEAKSTFLDSMERFLRQRDREVHNRALQSAHDMLRDAGNDIVGRLPLHGADRMVMANAVLALSRDNCEECFGENEGVLGNENIIGNRRLCDDCHARII